MNPYLISFLAISLDYGSYKWAAGQGPIREVNPIVFNQEIVKASQVILIGKGLQILDKKNPKLSKKVKIGLIVINVFIASHNIRQGMKANEQRRN